MRKISLLIIAIINFSACGYTFRGGESVLPPDVKTIFVPIVRNATTEPGIDIILTEALRDEFERYGVLQVTESRGGADAVLEATIQSINQETRTSTSNTDNALQQATVMIVSAELRRKSGPLLWKNPTILVTKVFGLDSSAVVASSADFATGGIDSSTLSSLDALEVTRGQQKQALEELTEQVATRVYTEAVLPEF